MQHDEQGEGVEDQHRQDEEICQREGRRRRRLDSFRAAALPLGRSLPGDGRKSEGPPRGACWSAGAVNSQTPHARFGQKVAQEPAGSHLLSLAQPCQPRLPPAATGCLLLSHRHWGGESGPWPRELAERGQHALSALPQRSRSHSGKEQPSMGPGGLPPALPSPPPEHQLPRPARPAASHGERGPSCPAEAYSSCGKAGGRASPWRRRRRRSGTGSWR